MGWASRPADASPKFVRLNGLAPSTLALFGSGRAGRFLRLGPLLAAPQRKAVTCRIVQAFRMQELRDDRGCWKAEGAEGVGGDGLVFSLRTGPV
jgi:hypothetical protein